MAIYCCTAGWSYDDWVGYFYPKRQSKSFNFLEFQAQHLDGVEVNSSFYAVPRRDYVQRWMDRTPPDYRFTFKILQTMTHGYPKEPTLEEIAAFKRALTPAIRSGKLLALLMQFPPFFADKPKNRDRIRRIREVFPETPLVLEVRHPDWNAPEALEFANGLDLGWCNVDMPAKGGGHIETERTASEKISYIRLHGRRDDVFYRPVPKHLSEEERDELIVEKYNYLYSVEEMEAWAQRIGRLAQKSQNVVVVANNHFQGKAPANALMLKSMLAGEPVAIPEPLAAAYPQLDSYRKRTKPEAKGQLTF